ncbi:MAG TPA: tetratricopeptide repeat protein, partial [Saprospiraceae bacterium]|nr:tetratricopeptide repeat protein [Saprospiraceae bacterium]
EKELELLIDFAKPLLENKFAGVAYIYGEAGIGKSRLTYEFRQALEKTGEINWLNCPADQILRKSFNPFIYFLKTHFAFTTEQNAVQNKNSFELKFRELTSALEQLATNDALEIVKELNRTKSILAGMIGINYANSLWEQLDARGRFQNELSALTNLFIGKSLIRPAVMYLEDGHWYDNSSKVFLSELSRKFSHYPLLILISSRYHDDGSRPVLFDRGVLKVHHLPLLELDLKMFEKNVLKQFAEKRLEGKVSESFLQILQKATNGNPFYTEQVIEYFSECDFLLKENGVWNIKNKSIKLSSSINAILMARIDRLSLLVKETVKAAAVIGREFEVPVLSEVLKESEVYQNENGNQLSLLHQQIKTAEQGQIWRPTNNNLRYLFQHALLREAVYEMQLHTQLRHIHRLIAEAIEKLYEDDLESHYFDLAFHYEHSEILEKTILYQGLAAAHAVRNFQNAQAHELYQKLIESCRAIGNEEGVISALLHKAKIEEHIGEWEACESSLNEALELAQKNNNLILLGKANNQLGKLIMLKGKYEDAGMYLETAVAFFMDVSDEGGLCDAFGNMGNLFFRQGKYEDAKSFFIDSIAIAQKNPEIVLNPQIVANLGLTHMNQGNYEAGIECQRIPLFLSEQRKDKPTMAILYTHMGIVYLEKGDNDEALVYFEKGLAISEALGNKQLKAIAIGSIGTVYEKKGDFETAMANYQADLELCLEMGDKQGTAIALGLIGELHNIMGAFDKAVEFLERKYVICEQLNYQKGIAKTLNALGDTFAYTKEFEKAIVSYTQAINVSRAIDNKLVLGFSLVEIGDVQLRMAKIKKAQTSYQEALKIAEPLGNPDLLFEVKILGAKILHAIGKTQKAIKDLKKLLTQNLDERELAATHYELNKFFLDDNVHRKKAFELYQKLYEASPQHLFKLRLDALKKRV